MLIACCLLPSKLSRGALRKSRALKETLSWSTHHTCKYICYICHQVCWRMRIFGFKSFEKLCKVKTSPHHLCLKRIKFSNCDKCSLLKNGDVRVKPAKVRVKNPALIKALTFTLYLCSEADLCCRVQKNALAGDVNVYQWKYLDLYAQTDLLSCGNFNLKRHKHLWASSGFSLTFSGLIQMSFSVTSFHLIWAKVFGSWTKSELNCSPF